MKRILLIIFAVIPAFLFSQTVIKKKVDMSSMHFVGTAPAVNAGTDQSITLPTSTVTLTGTATPASGTTISAYAWTKVSGGSATITSASSASTTVTGLVEGVYVFRLTATNNLSQSGSDDITVTVNAAATPTMSVSPTSLTLSTTAGTASTAQTFSVTHANLTSGLVINGSGIGMEVSDNGGSSYAGSLSYGTGAAPTSPFTVHTRIPASATAGSISGNITLVSTGATTRNVAITGTVTGGGAGIVAKFNFNLTAQSVADWVDVSGSPHSAVVTASDSRSGSAVTVSSKATAGWVPLSANSSGNSGGETTGNAAFPANTVVSYWFTNTSPQTTPNVEISGLVPGATYKIELYGSRLASAVTGTSRLMRYGCTDASTAEYIDDYDVKGNTSTTMRTSTNTGANTGGTTTGGGIATFNSKTADGSGKIQILVTSRNPNDGNNAYGYLGAMIITKL